MVSLNRPQDFALSQTQFTSLCREDQRSLLRSNTGLYLQYVLGRYFNAKSGLDQLNWILEGKLFSESVEEIENLLLVSFDDCIKDQVSSA
jgi:hypothetical protein